MIADDRIRELIGVGNENRNLDYKGPFSWATFSREEKLGFVKDVLAFSNTRDGGIILVGVEDRTGALIGLTDEEASSFDQTTLNDFTQNFTDPRHTCNVYRRVLDGKKLVVIEVPEFSDVPVVCKQDGASSVDPKKLIVRRAAFYKRTDKATSQAIDDADELRELLNRALLRRQDELMAAMSRIINPQKQPRVSSVGYEKEIARADTFINSKIKPAISGLGYWSVTFRPFEYVRERIPELRTVQSMVRNARVTFRGRNFPNLPDEGVSNFRDGFQAWTNLTIFGVKKIEAFRAYSSGLFRWKGALWEDTHPAYSGKRLITLAGMIFSFTDWVTFAQRYYESLLKIDDSLHYKFRLHEAKGRALLSLPPSTPLLGRYASEEDQVVVEGTVDMAELRSGSDAVARRNVRRAFEIFNWNTVTDEIIGEWQRNIDARF